MWHSISANHIPMLKLKLSLKEKGVGKTGLGCIFQSCPR